LSKTRRQHENRQDNNNIGGRKAGSIGQGSKTARVKSPPVLPVGVGEDCRRTTEKGGHTMNDYFEELKKAWEEIGALKDQIKQLKAQLIQSELANRPRPRHDLQG